MADERRKYRRIQAPVYCRPGGVSFLGRHRQPVDLSIGGVRVFSDDRYKVGELVKMEFFVEDVQPVTYTAEVVWIDPLPEGEPAKYDVGLKFIDLSPPAIKLLVSVLGPEGA